MLAGLAYFLQCLTRGSIRTTHEIDGHGFIDFCASCCCGCYVLVQAEKESMVRTAKVDPKTGQPYRSPDGMNHPWIWRTNERAYRLNLQTGTLYASNLIYYPVQKGVCSSSFHWGPNFGTLENRSYNTSWSPMRLLRRIMVNMWPNGSEICEGKYFSRWFRALRNQLITEIDTIRTAIPLN